MKIDQNWSEEFQTSASIEYHKYQFEDVSSVATRELDGSTWAGSLGGVWRLSERASIEGKVNVAEDFTIASDSSTNTVQLVKFSRPEVGALVKWAFWKGKKGQVALVPNVSYAFSGKSGASSTDGHFSYGLGIEANKLASRFFSSTGMALFYSTSEFNSTQGKTTNSALRLQLNFSFDY